MVQNMNKVYLISIPAVIIVLILAVYGSDISDLNSTSDVPKYIPITVTSTVIPNDISKANNEFAVDFYSLVSDDDDDREKNIFFSPTSAYVAFSMIYEGAGGDTAKQMQDVFGFEPDDFLRHNSTAYLMSSLNQDDQYATLEMANALWIDHKFTPYESYLDIVHKTYNATAETIDLKEDREGSASKINSWASEKTRGKIPKVIEPSSLGPTIDMVVNNAIYFKGTWLTQFSEEDTMELDFIQNSSSYVKADFMRNTALFDYVHSDSAQVLKMPYEGDRLSMLVILPDNVDGIEQLEDMISAKQIQKWNDSLKNQEIIVSIPKFEMNTHYDLKKPLVDLGMPNAFSGVLADFKGIGIPSGNNLYIAFATQDAYVKINEEGTEAAAVTTIGLASESAGPPIPIFTADHPFLFIIQDNSSDTILFMGKLYNPLTS